MLNHDSRGMDKREHPHLGSHVALHGKKDKMNSLLHGIITLYSQLPNCKINESFSHGCLLVAKTHMAKNVENSLSVVCIVRKINDDLKIFIQSG